MRGLATLRKRAAELERPKHAATGGVLVVPPILPHDEWERRAMRSQAALMQATHEDIGGAEPLVEDEAVVRQRKVTR